MKKDHNFYKTTEADLDEILALESKKENRHWIFPYPRSRHLLAIQDENEFHFCIKSDDETLLGFIILAKSPKEHDSIEFRRIVIDKKGQGLGCVALKWIKHYAFEKLNAHRLWLDVFTDNRRALGLYLNEGFVREGVKRACIANGGNRRNLLLMSMLKAEYNAFKARHVIYWEN